VPYTMLEDDEIETVDAEPMLSVDTRLAGLPAELPAHLAAELAELIEDAERYAAAAQAINTTRAYASDWNQFQAWCERYRLESLPASAAVVGLYVTSLARRGWRSRRSVGAPPRAHTARPATCPRRLIRGCSRSWRASPGCTAQRRTRRPRCSAIRCSS
jgi:hypothetical protein